MAIQVLGGLMEQTEGWLIAKTSADGQYRTLGSGSVAIC